MTRKKALLLFLLLLALSGYLFLNHEWHIKKDILYLKNGTTLITEETWKGGNLVYYKQDNKTSILVKEDVEYIGKGEIQKIVNGQEFLTQYVKLGVNKAINLFNNRESEIAIVKKWFFAVMDDAPPWILFVIVLLVCYLAVRILKHRFRKKVKISKGLHLEDPVLEREKINTQDFSDTEKIVSFFLDLYKLQIGAAPNAVAELFPVDVKTFGSNKVFQLRVKHEGEWASRRMTIGPLGEESGSKSKCYYVIYDVHMVIKIPPTPLQDFDTYIKNIEKEGRIVDKLAPRECITPRVSVILQRVYTFARKDMPPDMLEERYIGLLRNRSDLQEYLKIDDTFVFFMDLSKYFFLGHIISNLHDIDQKLYDEIIQNPRIIWDAQAFAGRYGYANGAVCFQIQNIFAEYESELRQNEPQAEGKASLLQYQMKDWFLTHLAGNRIGADDKGLIGTTADDMNALLENVFSKNSKAIEEYRETVRKYIKSISFTQSKAQIESIVVNILDLLAWLRKKKVSMRDLKPDNLLVAGDTADYPKFLTSADKFTIGLIDVETAVDYETTDEKAIPQPQLGGTPNYATPSHLFHNESLHTVFEDLPHILHLQDWQATIAMIYKVAIGETLFRKTGKLMPSIINQIKKSQADNTSPQETIINASKTFWPSAIAEFNAKMNAKENLLDSVTIKLSDEIVEMVKDEALKGRHYFTQTIASYIETQTLFPDSKTHQQLRMASHKNITLLLAKWEKEQNNSQQHSQNQTIIKKIACLKGLEQLKQQAESLAKMQHNLDQTPVTFTLSELLSFMFNITLNAMYMPEWRTSSEVATAQVEDNGDDRVYEETI